MTLNFLIYLCGQNFVDFFEIQNIPTLIVPERAGTLVIKNALAANFGKVPDHAGTLVEHRTSIASLNELNEIVAR